MNSFWIKADGMWNDSINTWSYANTNVILNNNTLEIYSISGLYNSNGSAAAQLNKKDVTYMWFAIG